MKYICYDLEDIRAKQINKALPPLTFPISGLQLVEIDIRKKS